MAKDRVELQNILETILGSRNVYFQPPSSIKLKYPCIIYNKSNEWVNSADDMDYSNYNMYSITVIDKNPDTKIGDSIRNLPHCSFDRSYIVDNLNHYVYRLYY